MKVAIYSQTPMAAAPWELYKALKKYTLLEVNFINERNRYRDGRIFPYHLLWKKDNGAARAALEKADLWHVHNYFPPYLLPFIKKQKIMAQFHSLPRLGNWKELMLVANVSYTIAQPLQEKEYKLPGLPNIIDPDEYRPIKRPGKIRIGFAPTTKAPLGYPDSKAYMEVKQVLNFIATKKDVDISWIEGYPYEQNLEMKKKCHILIDDIATGNWHRTTLEGACFGCAVLNRIQKIPFFFANPKTLEERLLWLIDNRGVLKDYQERMRLWVLQHWHAMDLIKQYTRRYREALK